jgi:periplasmic divalent cation tolerance protein
MQAKIALVTAPSGERSYAMAAELVSSGLAACVNVIPSITSIYTWQGKVETEQEALLVIKTLASHLGMLETKLLALHPYDTPEFIVIDPAEVNEKYLAWLMGAVS